MMIELKREGRRCRVGMDSFQATFIHPLRRLKGERGDFGNLLRRSLGWQKPQRERPSRRSEAVWNTRAFDFPSLRHEQ